MSEKISEEIIKNMEIPQVHEKTFYYKFHLDKIFSFSVRTNNEVEKQPFLILAAFFIFALIISSAERLFFISEEPPIKIEFQLLTILLTSILLLMIGFAGEKYINKEKFANLISLKFAILKTTISYFVTLAIWLLIIELLIKIFFISIVIILILTMLIKASFYLFFYFSILTPIKDKRNDKK